MEVDARVVHYMLHNSLDFRQPVELQPACSERYQLSGAVSDEGTGNETANRSRSFNDSKANMRRTLYRMARALKDNQKVLRQEQRDRLPTPLDLRLTIVKLP